MNEKTKASKRWQEYSSDKLVTNMLSHRTTSIRAFTKDFVKMTQSLEKLTEEFKIDIFRPEHQKGTPLSQTSHLC